MNQEYIDYKKKYLKYKKKYLELRLTSPRTGGTYKPRPVLQPSPPMNQQLGPPPEDIKSDMGGDKMSLEHKINSIKKSINSLKTHDRYLTIFEKEVNEIIGSLEKLSPETIDYETRESKDRITGSLEGVYYSLINIIDLMHDNITECDEETKRLINMGKYIIEKNNRKGYKRYNDPNRPDEQDIIFDEAADAVSRLPRV